MNNNNYLKLPPNKIEVFEGKVEWGEGEMDIYTDKGFYLQDILYHKYDKRKVRITIELLD